MESNEAEPLLSTSEECRNACGALTHIQTPTSTANVEQQGSKRVVVLPLRQEHQTGDNTASLEIGDSCEVDPETVSIEEVGNEERADSERRSSWSGHMSSRRERPRPVANIRPSYGSLNNEANVNQRHIVPIMGVSINSIPSSVSLDEATTSTEVDSPYFGLDDTTVLQACVFIEDAIEYRSIHHRVDGKSLKLYRFYYSKIFQGLLYFVIFVLHILPFFEFPSSLTVTSDLRTQKKRIHVPCGVTEAIDLACLFVLLFDLVCKSYLKGKVQFMKSKWLWASGVILIISFIDWSVSIGFLCAKVVRVRRMLRPFFLLQNSSLMKKTVNCLRKTVPHVVSVLLLLFLHLYFFTLFGMLLFPKDDSNNGKNETGHSQSNERDDYFKDPIDAFMSLLVLLTTANNPDVTMPAYQVNRLYAIFFIIFLVIGLYCLMNMLTAVIYNQFRGYFSDSIQASLFRRRLGIRAAYEALRRRQISLRHSSCFATLGHGVPVEYLEEVISKTKMKTKIRLKVQKETDNLPGRLLDYQEFQMVFSVLDKDVSKKSRPSISVKQQAWKKRLQRLIVRPCFNYFGCFVAGANVLCITLELSLEYDHIRKSRNTYLGILNLLFVVYFCVEQTAKVWAMGWNRYVWDLGNVMDGFVTLLLVLAQGVYVSIYGIPFWGKDHSDNKGISLWDLVRIINILIMIRLIRMIISQIKAMSIVSSTLFDLVKNLRAFAGILVVIYYSYALLGMELFEGAIKYDNATDFNLTHKCGTYRELQYWANNFDDFAAALVVLWDVMVVNNWHVFLHAYREATNGWSQLYFIFWWLLSVVITLNLFTALILENFIMRWDRQQRSQTPSDSMLDQSHVSQDDSFAANYITVHDMFRSDLQEPTDEALSTELRQHPHFVDHS